MSASELSSYQLQLEQVKAALTSEPTNEELLKLQTDLEQVIQLTQELIQTQISASHAIGASTSAATPTGIPSPALADTASTSSRSRLVEDLTPVKHWQVGEQCQALWHKDGLYYEATINEITTDGEVSLTFKHNGQQGVTSLGLLQFSKMGVTGTESNLNKREQMDKQREYLKKKKQKKMERYKNMEKEREKEKNKWQNFSIWKERIRQEEYFQDPGEYIWTRGYRNLWRVWTRNDQIQSWCKISKRCLN
ncbi:hypothetical protein TCAL_09983 [Tigriopus californicus]|uniref:Tudor domain-containing protein n=1 Tax=Tigriopus californicus TaxID=6832 RepID=A0A553P1M4_TIGCA|nr:hypothetical protein TCAL_09983 [Tigriopus californicus]